MIESITGGCFCGAVRYRAMGLPYNLTHCHCVNCRKLSAAPFVTWASFQMREFEFLQGQPAAFASSEHALRQFCDRCGTPLTFQLHPDEIDVTVCSFDHLEQVVPQDHTWTVSQLAWINLADSLLNFSQARE